MECYKKNNHYKVLSIALTVILGLILFSKSCVPVHEVSITRTDTVYVDRPYKEIVIKTVEIEKPKTVYVYRTDTVYRKLIEKDTLISSIEFTPRIAKVHIITPMGLPMVKEYPLPPDVLNIRIDHKGNTAVKRSKHPKRKKFLRRLKQVSIFVAGVIVGNKLHSK